MTNVPGPQFPLYLDGRELTDMFPMVPLGRNLGLGLAIVSYNGALNFGLVGDFNALPDLEELAGDFVAAVEELAAASRKAVKAAKPRPRRESRKSAPARNRTWNLRIKSPLLCQLSYRGAGVQCSWAQPVVAVWGVVPGRRSSAAFLAASRFA